MIIETERLLLRPIVESDAQDIFNYCSHADVGPNAGWEPHATLEDTQEIMKTVFLEQANVFGAVLKETGVLFGSIGLMADPRRQNPSALMLGYAIGKDYWGRGYGTETAKAIIGYGFDKPDIDLISAYCYTFNERSKNILTKCGFTYEGTLRRAEKRFDGEVLDLDCFSILR